MAEASPLNRSDGRFISGSGILSQYFMPPISPAHFPGNQKTQTFLQPSVTEARSNLSLSTIPSGRV